VQLAQCESTHAGFYGQQQEVVLLMDAVKKQLDRARSGAPGPAGQYALTDVVRIQPVIL
jgi:hypothetical protein